MTYKRLKNDLNAIPNKALLTRKESAKHLGISVSTLNRLLMEKKLAYIQRKKGSKVLIRITELDAYLVDYERNI